MTSPAAAPRKSAAKGDSRPLSRLVTKVFACVGRSNRRARRSRSRTHRDHVAVPRPIIGQRTTTMNTRHVTRVRYRLRRDHPRRLTTTQVLRGGRLLKQQGARRASHTRRRRNSKRMASIHPRMGHRRHHHNHNRHRARSLLEHGAVKGVTSSSVTHRRTRPNRRSSRHRIIHHRSQDIGRRQTSMAMPTRGTTITRRRQRRRRPQHRATRGARLTFRPHVKRQFRTQRPRPRRRRHRSTPRNRSPRHNTPYRSITSVNSRQRTRRVNSNRTSSRSQRNFHALPNINSPLNSSQPRARRYTIKGSQGRARTRRQPMVKDRQDTRVAHHSRHHGHRRCLFRQAFPNSRRRGQHTRTSTRHVNKGRIPHLQGQSTRATNSVKRGTRRRRLQRSRHGHSRHRNCRALFREKAALAMANYGGGAGNRGLFTFRLYVLLFL